MNVRTRALVFFAALAFGSRAFAPAPAPRSVAGLVEMLGRAAGGTVRPSEIAWEPSPGALTELWSGRHILFLSQPKEGGPRDVFRARVRLTLEGRPVAVKAVRNLTATPLGDDQELVIRGERAAFATASYGKVESVTLLDLRGRPAPAGASRFDAWMSAISNEQETGSRQGVGRVDISLDAPCAAIKLAFSPRGDELSIVDERGRGVRLDAASGTLLGDPNALAARASLTPSLAKRPILWAVDTVRAEVGPEPVARLEEAVFRLRDWAKRAGYAAFGASSQLAAVPESIGFISPVRALDAADAGADTSVWPPAPIRSIWKNPGPAEGAWEPITFPWLKRLRLAPSAPPYFYKTTIRPDLERPYVKVIVVAMDMRQLELDMEGGVEDPKPLTGARGAGKIPRDPKILGRVVGAFNGAFKTTHGEYGMMVDRRVLLPPKPNAATLIVTQDHRVGLGTWGVSTAIPDDLLSFRQNLEPLVEDGRVSPSGRTQWGFQLTGTSMFTERTGICLTGAGQLYYLWGDELSGSTLGKAMLQAGCTYGMHLDMNPHHTGFVFASVRSYANKDYDARLLTPAMEIMAERYLEWAPKDFFYIMLREPAPAGELAWSPDPATQPAPAWLPAVWRAVVPPSSSGGKGAEVELLAFDTQRVAFRVRPGVRQHKSTRSAAETDAASVDHDFLSEELSSDDGHRVIASIGLGNPPKEGREARMASAGLAAEGAEGYLVAREETGIRIAAAPELARDGLRGELALPWLLQDGKLVLSHERSARPRGAICEAATGHVVVALATTDSDEPLGRALMDLGCTRALVLDRGSHRSTFVHRAGGASPPLSRYDESALYAISAAMPARAFRWRP